MNDLMMCGYSAKFIHLFAPLHRIGNVGDAEWRADVGVCSGIKLSLFGFRLEESGPSNCFDYLCWTSIHCN